MTQISDRQYELVALADITTVTALTTTIDLPVNAMVTGMNYCVYTAAGGTSPTLTMVDDLGSPNTYLSAVAIGAVANGVGAAAEIGNFYPSGATLSFTVGGTSPTGGRVLVAVKYVILNRGNENFGQ
jgi:hypothetical protein